MCARDFDADQNADLLDLVYLGNLARHLGAEATAGLLMQGIEDLTGRLDALAALDHRGGGDALARAAHDIVGGAGQLGLPALTQLARDLEAAANAGRAEEAGHLRARIADSAPRAFDALRGWISRAR